MSEERENSTVGAPVEESETSHTEVLEAVERAQAAVPVEAATVKAEPQAEGAAQSSPDAEAEQMRREHVASLNTQLDIDTQAAQTQDEPAEAQKVPAIRVADQMPSAAAQGSQEQSAVSSPVRDGEIRISADHPMLSLYVQTPLPPETKGNRGAGVLVSFLATIGFAAVYAGVLSLWLAPQYTLASFLNGGLLPFIVSWGFAVACAAFLIGMIVLVLIVGRAGWWAYVLGGFPVAVLVWAASIVGFAAHQHFALGQTVTDWSPLSLAMEYGFSVPVLSAALVARETAVWFGAWIGARGRRMKRQNASALAEYEVALAEAQAAQS